MCEINIQSGQIIISVAGTIISVMAIIVILYTSSFYFKKSIRKKEIESLAVEILEKQLYSNDKRNDSNLDRSRVYYTDTISDIGLNAVFTLVKNKLIKITLEQPYNPPFFKDYKLCDKYSNNFLAERKINFINSLKNKKLLKIIPAPNFYKRIIIKKYIKNEIINVLSDAKEEVLLQKEKDINDIFKKL